MQRLRRRKQLVAMVSTDICPLWGYFQFSGANQTNPNEFPKKLVLVWISLVRESAPKGQFTHSPRQAKRRLGYCCQQRKPAPCKGNSQIPILLRLQRIGVVWGTHTQRAVRFAHSALGYNVLRFQRVFNCTHCRVEIVPIGDNRLVEPGASKEKQRAVGYATLKALRTYGTHNQ